MFNFLINIFLDKIYAGRGVNAFRAHWSARIDRKTQFDGYNTIGRRCRINNSKIGRLTYFAADTKVTAAEIGSFCSVGQECIIGGLSKHPVKSLSTHPAFFSSKKQSGVSFVSTDLFSETGSVIIGNDVWIGARCMILDGVTIGDGAVIAAGSVVVKNIPPYAIVGGVPAKIIKYRFDEVTINHLIEVKWWNIDLNLISKIKFNEVYLPGKPI